MRLFYFLTLVLGLSNISFAQILEPVKWKTEHKQVSDNEFDLIFTAKIDDKWSIYSQYLEGDDGPIPTSFEYDPGDHFELIGKNEESGNRKESFDKVFEMNLIKFSKTAIFTQRVNVSDLSKTITGYLTFMTCDDTRCLPPTDVDFEFKLKSTSTGATSSPEKNVENIADAEQSAPQNTIPDMSGQGSGILEPVKWSATVSKKSDGKYEVVTEAKIDEGWYVYSQYLESDDGPEATAFTYDEGGHYMLVGKNEESGNLKEGYDKVFEMNLAKFNKTAIFTQQIETSDESKPITGFFTFMTCDDEKCLPPTDVDFYIDPSSLQAFVGEAATSKINSLTSNNDTPASEEGVVDQARAKIIATASAPLGDCGGENTQGAGLFKTFIFGFIGGLIALLTPCVFPMIPLTVSFFTKGSKSRTEGIKNGLLYGASIIVIYVALGLIITAIFGPEALNRLSTHWLPNTIFFLLFVAFAISFFGYYEITLPSSWANKSDTMADKGGLVGIFFMAATLAIVSFSCTGPIIGSALVESAKNTMGPFVVMLGFSSALALPFGLFAAFPAWLNSLPSSGSWMNSVKVILGFLELAFAFKFLSVADYTFHWGILKYELFMGIWVLIFAAMTLYLFGFIKFPHDSPLKKLSPARWGFALTSLLLTVYTASGFIYNDTLKSYQCPGLLSGLPPPALYNFFLETPKADPTIKAEYPSFTKCANNLDCFKDYTEGMDYAKKNDLPVLLDFTGYGCVNCRKTEDNIWSIDKVRNNIEQNFVLISLYVDAPDKLENTPISKYSNKKLRNVGNMWADFQIVNFQSNSQPLYVMMTPEEEVMALPRGYYPDADDYSDYLDCGLQTFKSLKEGKLGMSKE